MLKKFLTPIPVSQTKFQYATWQSFSEDIADPIVMEGLNDLGEDGWEICSTHQRPQGYLTYFLRRAYTAEDGPKNLPHKDSHHVEQRHRKTQKEREEYRDVICRLHTVKDDLLTVEVEMIAGRLRQVMRLHFLFFFTAGARKTRADIREMRQKKAAIAEEKARLEEDEKRLVQSFKYA